MERSTRHVTLSNTRGMVTELEMAGASYTGSQFLLRYHKSDKAGALIDISSFDAASWSGFRYRDTQWSFVKFAAKPGTVVGLA